MYTFTLMYSLNYLHAIIYFSTCFVSYYIAYVYMFPFCIPCSIMLGWSLFGLVTVGHDCMHGTFSPYPMVNNVLSFICLNCVLMPRSVWQEEHSFHHSNPGAPEDHMILEGKHVFDELKHLLCGKHKTTWSQELTKIPLIVLLFLLPLYCVPLVWLTTLCSFAYLSLTTHIVSPNIRELDHTKPKHAKDIAINIFPSSHIYCLLAGGLNLHAPHHENPRWTRSQLMHESKDTQYKTINTVAEFLELLKHRS